VKASCGPGAGADGDVPLRPELKTKAEVPHGFVGEEGCADSSLYRRFHMAGLTQVQMFPQFAASNQPGTAQAQFAHSATGCEG
jgi:hypothetical protein